MNTRLIRNVLIVEDNLATPRYVADAISVFPGAVTQRTTMISEAERMAKRTTFDLAVIDLRLPDGSGIALIERFAEITPATICVAYTMFDDDATLFSALSAGAQGYLLKGEPEEQLQERLLAAAQGDPVISPTIARKVLQYFRAQHVSMPLAKVQSFRSRPLTERESDTLALIGNGMTVAEVARELGVSQNTIKTHIKAAYSKLNIKTRAGAVIEAQRLGLLRRPYHPNG